MQTCRKTVGVFCAAQQISVRQTVRNGGEVRFAQFRLQPVGRGQRITIRVLNTFRKVSETRELLLDITEDGMITPDERGDMQTILSTLEEMEQVTQSLKLWVKKNL